MKTKWLKRERKSDYLWIGLFSLLLGFAISAAMGLHYTHIRGNYFENYIEFGTAGALRGLGFAAVAFLVMLPLTAFCERTRLFVPERTGKRLSERKFFFLVWGVLVLAWTPWLMTWYPGGIVGDGAITLENALETAPMENHWVIAYILVLRLFLAIGRWFSEDVNVGVFLYVIFSCCLYAAACSAVVTTLRRKGVPRVLLVCFVFMYGFFGHFASYSMTLWKDGLFSAGVTELALLLWREPDTKLDIFGFLRKKKKAETAESVEAEADGPVEKTWVWAVKAGLVLLFLCLWRNFVGYGILVVGLLLLLFRWRKQMTALLMVGVAAVSFLIQGPVYDAIGVNREGDTVEALAVPIQQISAAIAAETELTEEQQELLFSILPEEQWLELYTPALCDSVKFEMNERVLKENMGAFIKVWAQLLPKNFGTYVEAYLLETLGYWQPFGSNQGYYYDYFTGIQDLYGRGYRNRDLVSEISGYSMKSGMNRRMAFVPSGTAVWIMLLCAALVLCQKKERKKKLAVLLPFLMIWAGVMVSAPIAYSYRYVQMVAIGLPIFVTLPMIRETEVAEGCAEEKKCRIRKALQSKKIAAAAAAALAVAAIAVTLAGTKTNRSFAILTSGTEDNASEYVEKGLSGNEGAYTWTSGQELVVRLPYTGAGGSVQVTIKVIGTFNGEQHYEIRNDNMELIAEGALAGAGEIVFRMPVEEEETIFRMYMPDAIRVCEVLPDSADVREVAFQIERIDGVVE